MDQDGFSPVNSPPLPAEPTPALVPCPSPDCPCRPELLRLRQQAGYWQAMHQRAVARLDLLQPEIDELRAKLRLRERQLFERKSEKTSAQPQTPLPLRLSRLPSGHAVSNQVAPARPAAATTTCPRSKRPSRSPPTSNSARIAANPGALFPAPTTANCWKSTCVPIAASTTVTVIAPAAPVAPNR